MTSTLARQWLAALFVSLCFQIMATLTPSPSHMTTLNTLLSQRFYFPPPPSFPNAAKLQRNLVKTRQGIPIPHPKCKISVHSSIFRQIFPIEQLPRSPSPCHRRRRRRRRGLPGQVSRSSSDSSCSHHSCPTYCPSDCRLQSSCP